MLKKIILLLFIVSVTANSRAQVQSIKEESKSAYIEAIEAFVNEEFDQATILLLEAYNESSPNAGISFALADVYFMQDDLPNAAFGKEAVQLTPKINGTVLNLLKSIEQQDRIKRL